MCCVRDENPGTLVPKERYTSLKCMRKDAECEQVDQSSERMAEITANLSSGTEIRFSVCRDSGSVLAFYRRKQAEDRTKFLPSGFSFRSRRTSLLNSRLSNEHGKLSFPGYLGLQS